jgi:Ca-activated chloride channel family protein
VTLVSLLASVLDKDGRPALGLTTDQFEVYEEGVKQKIEVLDPETQQPLDLALMIDSSLSETRELEFEEEAAGRFIQKLVRPADRLGVFEFADAVTQLGAFSSDVPALQASLRRTTPGDGTALYDAIFLGAQGLAKNPPGRRRAIVLVTDAGETTSRADFETARRAALRADTLLYTIVVRAVKNEGGRNTAGEHALETIADTTGGAIYFPDTIAQLGDMFELIDRELRTQYRIAYYPDPRPPAGTYRSLEVRAKCACKVRSRKAYYSGGRLD